MDETTWIAPPGAAQPASILSTAGAVPIYNEKGERSMKKVKVQRYVSGKRPDYAPASSDEEESEEEDFTQPKAAAQAPDSPTPQKSLTEAEMQDPRLRRLRSLYDSSATGRNEYQETDEADDARLIHKAEVVEMEDEEDTSGPYVPFEGEDGEAPTGRIFGTSSHMVAQSDSESDDEVDEEELALRRMRIRDKAMQRTQEEQEVLGQEEEGSAESSEEEDEEDESEAYSDDSESETEGPRLKPVFVRKSDRVTIQQKELEKNKQRQREVERKRRTEERRREMLHLIQQENRQPLSNQSQPGGGTATSGNTLVADPSAINTDDEADEAEYESWKLRELRRLKRDKEEREALEKEKEEVDKMRSMTEEERRVALRSNPKVITNKSAKGKYKFLQKYYHRGVFFLDKEDQIYNRDYSGATLEDHFDKTILPKVMQVKNFGRSGRTKYTHLIDQDTTSFDSPWAGDTQMNYKFSSVAAGGMKQVFERPSVKSKSVTTKATSQTTTTIPQSTSSGGQSYYKK